MKCNLITSSNQEFKKALITFLTKGEYNNFCRKCKDINSYISCEIYYDLHDITEEIDKKLGQSAQPWIDFNYTKAIIDYAKVKGEMVGLKSGKYIFPKGVE